MQYTVMNTFHRKRDVFVNNTPIRFLAREKKVLDSWIVNHPDFSKIDGLSVVGFVEEAKLIEDKPIEENLEEEKLVDEVKPVEQEPLEVVVQEVDYKDVQEQDNDSVVKEKPKNKRIK